jgi:hypothetical protein
MLRIESVVCRWLLLLLLERLFICYK